MLATVPGGIGTMSAIAADYGRNVALVALVQDGGNKATIQNQLKPYIISFYNF